MLRFTNLLIHSLLGLLIFAATQNYVYAMYTVQADTTIADTSSQKFGTILFEVEPDTAYLYLGNDYDNPILLTDGMKLRLSAGFHRMLVFGEFTTDQRIYIRVEDNELQRVQIQIYRNKRNSSNYAAYAAYKWNSNLMIFSDEETLISIMNTGHQSYGVFKEKLPPGSYRVQFRDERGKVRDRYIEVNAYELSTVVEYLRPRKGNSIVGGIIPGASQLYKKQPARAAVAFGAVAATTGLAIHYNRKLGSGANEFNSILRDYQNAANEQIALQLGNQLDQLHQDNKSLKRNRNIFRTTAILFYVANMVDAFREPDGGFAKSRTFDPFRDFSVDVKNDIVEARIQFRF